MNKRFLSHIGLVFVLFSFLSMVYADDAPLLDEIQAKMVAQDYLDSNGYSTYKAVISGTYPNVELLSQVKEKSSGQIMWINASKAKRDSREEYPKYDIIVYRAYVVNVVDKNGDTVGKIYVDGDEGKIVYKKLPGDNNSNTNDNQESNDLTYQGNESNQNEENSGGFQDIINSIIAYFQQLWVSIFG